jgi:hypothetical protein
MRDSSDFVPTLQNRLTLVQGRGHATVRQAYRDALNGRIPPQQGHMLSLA